MTWLQNQVSLRSTSSKGAISQNQPTISTAPHAVDSVSKSAIAATTVTISWVHTFPDPLLDFLVQVDLASGDYSNPVVSQGVASNLRALAVTGLTAETDYKYRVIARNSVALTASAVADTFTTDTA